MSKENAITAATELTDRERIEGLEAQVKALQEVVEEMRFLLNV